MANSQLNTALDSISKKFDQNLINFEKSFHKKRKEISTPTRVQNSNDSGSTRVQNSNDSGSTRVQNSNDSGSTRVQNSNDSGSTRVQNSNDSGSTRVQNSNDSGSTRVQNSNDSGSTRVQNSNDSGSTRVQNSNDSGSTRVQNSNDSGSTRVQNSNDSGSTRVQNSNDSGSTRVQNSNDSGSTRVQNSNDSGSTRVQNSNDSGSTRVQNSNDSGSTRVQNSNDSMQISELIFTTNQKAILNYLISNLENKKLAVTHKVQLNSMVTDLNIKKETIRTSIRRLKQMNVLTSDSFSKSSTGYFSKFILCKKLIKDFSYNSNSSLNKKTTTIEKKEKKISEQKDNFLNSVLPPEWEQIDTGPMENVGLTKNKLLDIFKSGNISAEGVQESINHFAWGYEHNSKNYQYKNLLTVFIGALRKGSLWSETGYESPKALALKKVLELKKKQQAEEDKLIDELVATEFAEWESKLTDTEKEKILPSNHGMFIDRVTKQNQLKAHFRNKVLIPRLRNEKVL